MEGKELTKRIGAWSELLKLAIDIRGLKKEVRQFYRGNAINALRQEGWFDFLIHPRTIEDIAGHFGYTDMDYLTRMLNLFSVDGLLMTSGETYRVTGPIEEQPIVLPKFFGSTMGQIAADSASQLSNRLKGKYGSFSEGINLFNWDDALGLKLYEQIRRAAFKFTDAMKRRGKFLDVGSGNGIGTVAIWGYYHKRGVFQPGSPMRIYGIEPDERLRVIAEEEFSSFAKNLLEVDAGG